MNYIDPQVEAAVREALEESMNSPIIPEDGDELPNGLETETISNVTPWYERIGLWNSDSLVQGKKPELASAVEEEEDFEGLTDEEIDLLLEDLSGDEEDLTDDEIDQIISELELEDDPEG